MLAFFTYGEDFHGILVGLKCDKPIPDQNTNKINFDWRGSLW